MSCIVQKFGGTSVATLERIKNVAEIIASYQQKKHNLVAVVSAMAGVTNKFISYMNSLGIYEGDPEYDSVVSSGELVTSGLLAVALKNLGLKAKSYASWQVPIFTNDAHGNAVIQKVDPISLKKDISAGIIPVISGFQGVSSENRITTLGRGGSDLTAVAVASAVNADLCEIYSDVDGVYTVDPNLYPEAKKIDRINYREMLEMASQGTKILQAQSVYYAMNRNVVVRVASSFINNGGTIISGDISSRLVCGLAVTHSLALLKVSYGRESYFNGIMKLLEENFIRAEIFQSHDALRTSIIMDKKKIITAMHILRNCNLVLNCKQEMIRRHFSLLNVIGVSISTEIREELSRLLRNKKIEIFGNYHTDHRISFVVATDQLLNAVTILHRHCGLNK
ncbi:MAG: aspartate kinase [Holosporaceae bacterium]|nr:aspartate kinase [Holosporaceae bacterium]